MDWRLSGALEKLRAQVNAMFPTRDKDSDGTIGDAAHASRSSDHNPWVHDGSMGVVTGMDITHDPASGCDSYALAEALRMARDPRIKYVISNRRIFAGSDGPSPWTWRPYSGANAHNHHVHISVKAEKSFFDGIDPWTIHMDTRPDPNFTAPPKTLRRGDEGDNVRMLQSLLGLVVDGDFGPKTESAVKAAQSKAGLVVDGIVGPQTWGALKG